MTTFTMKAKQQKEKMVFIQENQKETIGQSIVYRMPQ